MVEPVAISELVRPAASACSSESAPVSWLVSTSPESNAEISAVGSAP